jgi:hypothetical protein
MESSLQKEGKNKIENFTQNENPLPNEPGYRGSVNTSPRTHKKRERKERPLP